MDERPNIILTGFMGTGKTTVGRLVAELLDYEFVDTDAIIEQAHGPNHAIPVAAAVEDRRRAVVVPRAESGEQVIDDAVRVDALAHELARTREAAHVGFGELDLLIVRVRQGVYAETARGFDDAVLREEDTQADGAVDLLALGEVVGEILGDRAGRERDDAAVWSAARALSHDCEHAAAHGGGDVELAGSGLGLRVADVAPHLAVSVADCHQRSEGPVAPELQLYGLAMLSAGR